MRKSLISAGAMTLLAFLAVVALGLDWPTSPDSGKTDCEDCHKVHGSLGPSLLDATSVNNLCRSCHDGTDTGAPLAATHVKQPSFSCTLCHNAHNDEGSNDRHVKTSITFGGSNYTVAYATRYTDLVDTSSNNPRQGICQVCHTNTQYYRRDGTSPGGAHNTGSNCLTCHTHLAGFDPNHSTTTSCVSCHNTTRGGGTYAAGTLRRAIVGSGGDFQSGIGGHLYGSSDPTNHECVVCHAEGYAYSSTEVRLTDLHRNGSSSPFPVDLRDADSTPSGSKVYGTVYAVHTDPGNWPTVDSPDANANANLVTHFCATCHDSDGATASYTRRASSGGVASLPFGTGNGSPLNVRSMFNTGNHSSHALNGGTWDSSLGAMYTADWSSTGDPGIKSGAFANSWHSYSTTECSSCHLPTQYTATPAYYRNGHTSRALRWLQTDQFGDDRAYPSRTSDSTSSRIICFKCHASSVYMNTSSNSRFDHDEDNRHHDLAYSSALASSTQGNLSCFMCHGVQRDSGTDAPGGIHGVNRSDDIDNENNYSPGTYDRVRFSNGTSVDYFKVVYSNGNWRINCSNDRQSPWNPYHGSSHCTEHSTESRTEQYH